MMDLPRSIQKFLSKHSGKALQPEKMSIEFRRMVLAVFLHAPSTFWRHMPPASQTGRKTEDKPNDKTLGMTSRRSIRLHRQPTCSQRRFVPRNGLNFSKPASGGSSSRIAAMPSGHTLACKTVT
jgi:hypothetical protein